VPHTLPTPVAAALGLVPTAIDTAKRLPTKIIQLPVLAVSAALTTLNAWQQEYDALADRGERFVGHLRGNASFDDLEDKVDEWLSDTPVGNAYDTVEDAAEDAVAQVTDLLDRAAVKVRPQPKAEPVAEVPDAEAPKGEPTPSAPKGSVEKRDTAATADVLAAVDEAIASVEVQSPTHDTLPLADYDHMTLGSLRGRLRSLSMEELVAVRDYEKSHADRLPVVTLLDNRIAKLVHDAEAPGASLSDSLAEVLAPPPEGPAPVKKAPAKKAPIQKAPAKQAPVKKVVKKTAPTVHHS
jgi:hypothetical protein